MESTSISSTYDTHHHVQSLIINPYPPAIINLYFSFRLVGLVLIVILFLTIVLSKKIQRDRTLPNLLLVTAIGSVIDCLTWKPGHSVDTEPGYGWCRFQASLDTGNMSAESAAGVALVFKVWMTTYGLSSNRLSFLNTPVVNFLILLYPYLYWVVYMIVVIVKSYQIPEEITRLSLYCITRNAEIEHAKDFTAAISSVFIIALEAHLAFMVFSYYRSARRARRLNVDDGFLSGIPDIPATPLPSLALYESDMCRDPSESAPELKPVMEAKKPESELPTSSPEDGESSGKVFFDHEKQEYGRASGGSDLFNFRRSIGGSQLIDPLGSRLLKLRNQSITPEENKKRATMEEQERKARREREKTADVERLYGWQDVNMDIVMRTLTFGLVSLAITGCFLFIAIVRLVVGKVAIGVQSVTADMFVASFSLAAFLIFGSQLDIILQWKSWALQVYEWGRKGGRRHSKMSEQHLREFAWGKSDVGGLKTYGFGNNSSHNHNNDATEDDNRKMSFRGMFSSAQTNMGRRESVLPVQFRRRKSSGKTLFAQLGKYSMNGMAVDGGSPLVESLMDQSGEPPAIEVTDDRRNRFQTEPIAGEGDQVTAESEQTRRKSRLSERMRSAGLIFSTIKRRESDMSAERRKSMGI